MAIISTTPMMVRVATMWIGQEKGRLPKSSKRTALRACSTHKQTVIFNKHNHRVDMDSDQKDGSEVEWGFWAEENDVMGAVWLLVFFLMCKQEVFAHQNLYFPKVHYLIAIKNKMKSMDLVLIFLIQRSEYLRGTGSAARSAKQRVGWPIEQSSPTCHEVNTCRSQVAARTPREL